MGRCLGMGGTISAPENDSADKEVLNFIMEYEICPTELIRFVELYTAYESPNYLSFDAKALIETLVQNLIDSKKVTPFSKKLRGNPLGFPPAVALNLKKTKLPKGPKHEATKSSLKLAKGKKKR